MQYSPTIIIRRVVVLSKGRVVFDEKFHAGLNIIRGENSSGKSTLLDFLFFALGGEVTQWREAATHCDQVTIEIAINDKIVTLARDVDSAPMRPMRIFPGEMDGNTTGPLPSWSIYPFRGTSSKESFSQILFRWLQLPEVTGEASGRITMNQVLRLVYSDQITPIDRLFKEESFDTALIRQTVGDLLCGAYDDDLYQASLRLKEVTKAHEEAASELRSLFTALGDVRHSLTLDWLNAERSKLNAILSDLQDEVAKTEAEALRLETKHRLTLDEQNAAYRELRSHQKKIATLQQTVDNLQFEIADSRAYINSLQSKIVALKDARLTSQNLKGLAFSACPACYAPLDNLDNPDHCHLCSRPVDSERIGSRILLLMNDATLQLKQSQLLQIERTSELEKAQSELVNAKAEWRSSVEKYRVAQDSPSSKSQMRIRELHRRIGYVERQIDDLSEKSALVERVTALSEKKAALDRDKSLLTDRISAIESSQANQLSKAYTRIADNVVDMLKEDLDRQDTFKRADRVHFSFGDDRISVNGESFFSASSMVYLRNSFLVAFWRSSLQDSKFRYPRLLIMDTVEDKGMEPERSHNFQRIVRRISESSQIEHQVIIATSMIAPELEDSELVVGRFFTHEQRTLELEFD